MEESPRLWRAVACVLLSSVAQGVCYYQLNTETGDASAVGTLDLSVAALAESSSMLYWFGALGCLLTRMIIERFGRRACLLVSDALFVLGAALGAATPRAAAQLCARSVVGLALGLSNTAVPTLLAECAPARRRGLVCATHPLCLVLGEWLCCVVGWATVSRASWGWRAVSALVGAPCALQLLFACTLPESPRWLLRAHGPRACADGLRALGLTPSNALLTRAAADTAAPTAAAAGPSAAPADDASEISSNASADDPVTWDELFDSRFQIAVCLTLVTLQPLSGNTVVMSYSTELFDDVDMTVPLGATMIVVTLSSISVIASAFAIDGVGRRPMLLGALIAQAAGALIAGTALLENCPSGPARDALVIGGVSLFKAAYSVGLGTVPMLLMSELLDNRLRGSISATVYSWNFVVNGAVALGALSLIATLADGALALGVGRALVIFAAVCAFGFSFVFAFVDETNGQSLEEISRRVTSARRSPNRDETEAVCREDEDGETVPMLNPMSTAPIVSEARAPPRIFPVHGR